MQKRLVLVVLCVIILGCNSTDPHDLFMLKTREQLLCSQILLLQFKVEDGEITSASRDQQLNLQYDEVKERRELVPITDKLRESNVIDYLKSRMNNPFSFRLHDISYIIDYKPYSDYGYSIANVEYFGANAYGGTVREKERLRVSPHGFVMSRLDESLWR